MSIWIFLGLLEHRPTDVRYEDHERQFAEDGRTTAPPCVRNNDHQSFDGHPLGYAHHRSGAVFYSHNGDDRIVR